MQNNYHLRSKDTTLSKQGNNKTLFDDWFSVTKGITKEEILVRYFFDPLITYRRKLEDLQEVTDAYRPSNEIAKKNVRQTLSNLYLDLKLNGHVLTLDDCRASFSRHLNKVLNLPRDKIHVPNPFVSRSIVSQNKCIVYPHKVGSMIRNLHATHKPFSLIFLDYTSTWKGSISTSPSRDIESIFQYMKLTKVSVLAITICTRTTTKKKRYLEDVDEAKKFVVKCASKRPGYHTRCVNVTTYGVIATMIFVVSI